MNLYIGIQILIYLLGSKSGMYFTKTENPQREQNRLSARLVEDCQSMNTVTNYVILNVRLGKLTNVLEKDMPISYRCTGCL